MVWFEPERVYYGSAWAIEHPEYMLERPGADACLVNLGNPKACRWMSEYIGDFIEENNIDYYRQVLISNPQVSGKQMMNREGRVYARSNILKVYMLSGIICWNVFRIY